MKDFNSTYLYSVEGLNRVALGRWSNDVELLAHNLDTFSIDNQKRRFAGCIFDISDPIKIDAYNTKIWLIYGTNPESRESPDPFGKIRILPRADEGMMVEFWHDTAVDNFLASYEYIRELCHHLRIYGMAFESDIPSQVELGLESISSSFYLGSKFQTVKYCLLNTKAPLAFLLPRGSVEALPITIKRENEASCELLVDGFYTTPKWAKPDESIQYIQKGIISILISDYDPHTKIEINCRHEAFLPFVIKILRSLNELPGEKRNVIQREIDRLMFVDTYIDVEETAVSQSKDDQKDSNRKVIELLYWLSRSCQFDTNHPADLGWANEQFQLNWGPKERGELFPEHLHAEIPEILHNLMESAFLAAHPQNFPDAKTTGRFEEMENRNGKRISLYPPFGFQIYVTSYGLRYIERELRKGELGKKRNQNGDIDWNSEEIVDGQSLPISKYLTAADSKTNLALNEQKKRIEYLYYLYASTGGETGIIADMGEKRIRFMHNWGISTWEEMSSIIQYLLIKGWAISGESVDFLGITDVGIKIIIDSDFPKLPSHSGINKGAVKVEITSLEKSPLLGKQKKAKPQDSTGGKINALIDYREQAIKDRNQIPLWTVACSAIRIDPKTVKIHFPELSKSWENKDFRPEKWEKWE